MSKHSSPVVDWSTVYEWVGEVSRLGYDVGISLSGGHNRTTGVVCVEVGYEVQGVRAVVAVDREPFPLRGPDKAAGAATRAVARLLVFLEGKDPADLYKLARWTHRPTSPSRVAPRQA